MLNLIAKAGDHDIKPLTHLGNAGLNRGASFQPAAVRNLSGRPGEVQAIELEAIARGQVIVMQTRTASGDWRVRQRTAFALADDQLVPAAPIAPPSPSGQRPQLAELLK